MDAMVFTRLQYKVCSFGACHSGANGDFEAARRLNDKKKKRVEAPLGTRHMGCLTLEDIDIVEWQAFLSFSGLANLRCSSRAQTASHELVRRLCQLSRNGSAQGRKFALRALGWLCAPDRWWHSPSCTGRALEATRRCLRHRCLGIRRAAVGTLRWLGSPQDVPSMCALVTCLEDPQWQVRVASVRALGEMAKRGDDFVSSAVAKSLLDEAAAVRLASVISLGQLALPDSDVLVAVAGRLADLSGDVRKAALEVLQQLVQYNEALLAMIRGHLVNPMSKVRQDALRALGQIADNNPSTISTLLVHLADHSRSVRRAAVEVLGSLAGKGNVIALAALTDVRLHDPEACVRRAARAALTLLSPGRAKISCMEAEKERRILGKAW